MPETYCGINKLPKGKRYGSMIECAEQGQVRRYGTNKMDPKTLEKARDKDVLPETREKLIPMMMSLRGLVKRHKGKYETTKDSNAKMESMKIWKKAEADLKKVEAKVRRIEKKNK